tara:strand:+ start:31 stop:375 length:345 start_codon:yes stop_codon:yes gene_type:complete
MKQVLIGLGIVLVIFFVTLLSHAGEWNDKPVICEQKEVFEKLMVEQKKILLGTGDLLATVRNKEGLSDIPAVLPMRVYINPTTQEWAIVEYHQDYNSMCILGYGANWQLLGNKI